MVTCTTRNRTATASDAAGYRTPEIWMKIWMIMTGLLALGMFLAWSVGAALAVAFFGATAENIRFTLYACAAVWSIASLLNIAIDWLRVRARRGRLRIAEAGGDRVVVVAPHRIADALAPWFADAARPVVMADRLARLQTSYMAGQPDRHLEALLGLMVSPVARKSA